MLPIASSGKPRWSLFFWVEETEGSWFSYWRSAFFYTWVLIIFVRVLLKLSLSCSVDALQRGGLDGYFIWCETIDGKYRPNFPQVFDIPPPRFSSLIRFLNNFCGFYDTQRTPRTEKDIFTPHSEQKYPISMVLQIFKLNWFFSTLLCSSCSHVFHIACTPTNSLASPALPLSFHLFSRAIPDRFPPPQSLLSPPVLISRFSIPWDFFPSWQQSPWTVQLIWIGKVLVFLFLFMFFLWPLSDVWYFYSHRIFLSPQCY